MNPFGPTDQQEQPSAPNAPAPQGQDPSQGGPPAPQAEPLDVAHAQFDAAKKDLRMMEIVQRGLATLVKKADTVTEDDVIDEAEKIVAEGMEPEAMATLLSQMPQKGDQLAAWLGHLSAFAAQHEQELQSQFEQARHALGTASIAKLTHGALKDVGAAMKQTASQPALPAPGMNQLMQ